MPVASAPKTTLNRSVVELCRPTAKYRVKATAATMPPIFEMAQAASGEVAAPAAAASMMPHHDGKRESA